MMQVLILLQGSFVAQQCCGGEGFKHPPHACIICVRVKEYSMNWINFSLNKEGQKIADKHKMLFKMKLWMNIPYYIIKTIVQKKYSNFS